MSRSPLLLLLVACGGGSQQERLPPIPDAPPHSVEFEIAEEESGLQMVLSDADPPRKGGSSPTAGAQSVTWLSAAQVDTLLSRLPALEEQDADRQPFAKRDDSPPAPTTGQTLDQAFPPPARPSPVAPDPEPVAVVRFAPEGDVAMAPHLSITFNQAMVAVSSQEVTAETVPVRLEPEPEGSWRWLGTRTLLFDPAHRFPLSTDYEVTIPKGTRSAVGTELAEDVSFGFSTPTLTVTESRPFGAPQPLNPVLFLSFDQRIDADAVLPFVNLRTGTQSVPIRVATAEEIAADPVKSSVSAALEGQWLALKPVEALSKNTHYSVVVADGAPSAEGPKTVLEDVVASRFRTFSALKVTGDRCGWGRDCTPDASFVIEFNNPLDAASFTPDLVTVEPAIERARIYVSGSNLHVEGTKKGRSTYTVSLDPKIRDSFGQHLNADYSTTFKTTAAEPTLYVNGGEIVTLDPSGAPRVSVFHRNHKQLRVRIQRMSAEDWPKTQQWWEERYYDGSKSAPPPGVTAFNKLVSVDNTLDTLVETSLDLAPHLTDGHGQLLLIIEPLRQPRWGREEIVQWVQVTDLGLAAFADQDEILVWTTDLATGAAASEVTIETLPSKSEAQSKPSGLTSLGLKGRPEIEVLVARRGTDLALLPRSGSFWGRSGWSQWDAGSQHKWFVFDDRGMYKPGETLHLKGWVRAYGQGTGGDVEGVPEGLRQVSYTVYGSRGNELGKGQVATSELGGFDLTFALPDTANLGQGRIRLDNGTSSTQHSFRIQEFRRPEFEVSASVAPGHHVLGTRALATVSAAYYAGGGLPNAETRWSATASPTTFVPPNQDDFSFGPWVPWWGHRWGGPSRGGPTSVAEHTSQTDATGSHHLDIHFKSLSPPRPMSVSLNASVVDVNRQTWTAATQLVVHPANEYIGLKSEQSFVEPGVPWTVEAVVVDLEGERVLGRAARIRFSRTENGYKDGRWQSWQEDEQICEQTTAGSDPIRCTFTPDLGGRYQVLASIEDAEGRPNESEYTLYVTGGDRPPSRTVSQESIELIPDQKTYQPGDTAKILVQAPFFPATGVLTTRRSGLVHQETIQLDSGSTTLEVEIDEEHIPNLHVQLDLVGATERTDDQGQALPNLAKRPAWAVGNVMLEVPPLTRTLQVTVRPALEALRPGGETTVTVQVKLANGKPAVGAEVALIAVDEAVLALTDYQMPDPIALYYAHRSSDVFDVHQRAQLVLPDPLDETLAPPPPPSPAPAGVGYRGDFEADGLMEASAVMVEERKSAAPARRMMSRAEPSPNAQAPRSRSGGESQAIALRKDFTALALFEPALRTRGNGTADVNITLPDSLTRYRLMAVAVHGDSHFGKGESSITARNPLMVRPSPPRFLNFGDRFELPIVVQNQTDAPQRVEVAVRASNTVFLDALPATVTAPLGPQKGAAGRFVTVPARDRVEVRFPAAADRAGTARFQVAVSTSTFSDAAEFDLPVWTPATSEAFATYGQIDESGSILQPVVAPGEVWTQFGGLEVSTASTQLQALTDALVYLTDYRFECTEQLSSRIMAVATLRDVLEAFEAEQLQDAKALDAAVARDLTKLGARQNYDGGFPFWRKGDPSWPYISVHNLHAVARAQQKGYEGAEAILSQGRSYLANVESHIPRSYGERYRHTIGAYALYVRHLTGDTDATKAKKLYRTVGNEGVGLEALGWLLPVLHAGGATTEVQAILHFLNNRVVETAAGAHWTTSMADDGAHLLLSSDRRADAVLLDALITVRPESDLIPKVVRGLLAHRVRGRWGNTQENAFVLVAMDRYFDAYETVTPDFVARAWLGETFAGEHAFKGRSTDTVQFSVPMGYVSERPKQDLILQKDGEGRLYYRIAMRYAPRSLELEAADHGFAVSRSYEPVDDAEDLWRTDDGTVHVKAGARIRVRVSLAAPTRRYHVALVDPIPAGFEVMNPDLAVTGPLPEDPNSASSSGPYWWWSRTWYEHENLRDERVEAFSTLLWEGVHEYSYVALATTPGQFVVPPAKAEEMYHSETFGRSATTRVVVH